MVSRRQLEWLRTVLAVMIMVIEKFWSVLGEDHMKEKNWGERVGGRTSDQHRLTLKCGVWLATCNCSWRSLLTSRRRNRSRGFTSCSAVTCCVDSRLTFSRTFHQRASSSFALSSVPYRSTYDIQKYVWHTEARMTCRGMYDMQKYVWHAEVRMTYRSTYDIQRYIWHIEVRMTMTYRSTYDIQRYVWHTEVRITYRGTYDIQRYVWHTEVYMT